MPIILSNLLDEKHTCDRFPKQITRDISKYHVNERAPVDDDTYAYYLIYSDGYRLENRIQESVYFPYLLDGPFIQMGINQGLNDIDAYQQSVAKYLPSMMLCTQYRNIPDIVHAIVID